MTLVELARQGEQAGFDFLTISDHFHPWIDEQGHSPFVWSVLGAVAGATERVRVGTGVTCPILRIHPAIVAHAAATTALLFEGRFFLGLGSGEALNEHVLGQHWPVIETRQAMLEESIAVMRKLWTGDVVDHHGDHYTVENARLYDVPDDAIPVVVSAFGEKAGEMAGRAGDGIWMTSPQDEAMAAYHAGGRVRPEDRAAHRLLGREQGRCHRHRPSRLAQQLRAGPALPGPPHAHPLRAGRIVGAYR